MARTRSRGADKAVTSSRRDNTPSTSRYTLPAEFDSPPKVLILPDKATPQARVLTLTNPRYSRPSRYLVCPESGAYEFTRISAPKTTPRSWLIEKERKEGSDAPGDDGKEGIEPAPETQVTKGADLYIATPIDPLFLALPALAAQQPSSAKRMFLSSDDHLDSIAEGSPHLRETLRWPRWRSLLESRMGAACDTVEAGDETMFRLSEEKLLGQVLAKAARMSEGGLPGSMRDKFVTRALEAPVMAKKSNGVATAPPTPETSESQSDAAASQQGSAESQLSAATSSTNTSEPSTAATSVAGDADAASTRDVTTAIQASEEVVRLQSLRVAFNFICSSYVPPAMSAVLRKMLGEGRGAGVDFKPLDDYVAQLTKLRQEAMTARSASDYSRKRAVDEEDEDRREKRRKKEEDEKRKKAGESRGVRDLKKVNTAGMKKMSDFFTKKPKS
ncbi:hypothetical protein VSDG_01348 [Cytospora chrysosperma]|uniref:Ribonuclease H2 subunit B n=1 Tax=Cytospora chrysosperma TaxID=252740 RepID=A0A423WJL5_CYTCH|nr:hypothetical protein VSDG_01348 [Valsa sordida]